MIGRAIKARTEGAPLTGTQDTARFGAFGWTLEDVGLLTPMTPARRRQIVRAFKRWTSR